MTNPISPDFQGKTVYIAVKIGYPGSRLSDVVVGDRVVSIRNDDIMKAGRLYVEVEQEGGTEEVSTYDARTDTVAMFGGDEEFGQ